MRVTNLFGDATGSGNSRFGLVNFANTAATNLFQFGGTGVPATTGDLTISNRQFEVHGTNSAVNITNFDLRNDSANHVFRITSDLINANTGAQTKMLLSGTNTLANTFGGTIPDGPGIGGVPSVLSFVKNGGGTWVISGDNSYTGTTTVTAGKLFIDGDQTSATGDVTVSSGATLGGTGTLGGNTTIASGSKLEFHISTDAASHDKLEIATGKKLTFSGSSSLTITTSGGAKAGTYTLITAAGGINGNTPASLTLPSGWTATVSKSGNNLVLNLTSTGTLTPFQQWTSDSGLTGNNALIGSDPDGDGLTNLQEFAFGLHPSNPTLRKTYYTPGNNTFTTGLPSLV